MGRKFVINTAVSIPVYKQVISQIEQKIISGEYAPGYHLPSMNELAADLEISKETEELWNRARVRVFLLKD